MAEQKIWKYCYWLEQPTFEKLKNNLQGKGIEILPAKQNVCEALLSEIGYAEPQVWPEICKHDATPWYKESKHAGKNLVVSSFRLDEEYTPFLETTIEPVTFEPPSLPVREEKSRLVRDEYYKNHEPADWGTFPQEMGAAIVKGLAQMHATEPEEFKDLLETWTAVHANFINPVYRADAEFENAPYSIADSAHISSCCVELFNVIDSKEKALLVRPCIGGVIVKALQRDQYYLVRPVKNQ